MQRRQRQGGAKLRFLTFVCGYCAGTVVGMTTAAVTTTATVTRGPPTTIPHHTNTKRLLISTPQPHRLSMHGEVEGDG